jgi:hypothetical protein
VTLSPLNQPSDRQVACNAHRERDIEIDELYSKAIRCDIAMALSCLLRYRYQLPLCTGDQKSTLVLRCERIFDVVAFEFREASKE